MQDSETNIGTHLRRTVPFTMLPMDIIEICAHVTRGREIRSFIALAKMLSTDLTIIFRLNTFKINQYFLTIKI